MRLRNLLRTWYCYSKGLRVRGRADEQLVLMWVPTIWPMDCGRNGTRTLRMGSLDYLWSHHLFIRMLGKRSFTIRSPNHRKAPAVREVSKIAA